MKLSISVPVYNMEAGGKLEYCLNSLLNQTISRQTSNTFSKGEFKTGWS